jgi:hypothetical protein
MNRPFLIAFALPCAAALLLAQPVREPSRPVLRELESSIQLELESHGDRVMGHDAYRWRTRLEAISDCRAELKVRATNSIGEQTVHEDSIRFSLGAIERFQIEPQKSWLALPCVGHQKCISTVSTCTKTTKSGIVVDCSTNGEKREESLALQFDGDAGAASRLERDFRRAVELCREAAPAGF